MKSRLGITSQREEPTGTGHASSSKHSDGRINCSTERAMAEVESAATMEHARKFYGHLAKKYDDIIVHQVRRYF
jgi:hypothetical protein